MKRNSHYPLAALMHLAIWGAALPAQAADSSIPEEAKDADRVAANGEETMVVTAGRTPYSSAEIFSLDPEARHCPRL